MGLPCIVEFIKVDVASALLVEEAENDLVLGIGFRKQVLKDTPVMYVNPALSLTICDLEQNAILVALDFVLLADASLASLCLGP